MVHRLYLTPGATVEIDAIDRFTYTWPIKRSVPEQAEYDLYIDNSKHLWTEFLGQRLSVLFISQGGLSRSEQFIRASVSLVVCLSFKLNCVAYYHKGETKRSENKKAVQPAAFNL